MPITHHRFIGGNPIFEMKYLIARYKCKSWRNQFIAHCNRNVLND